MNLANLVTLYRPRDGNFDKEDVVVITKEDMEALAKCHEEYEKKRLNLYRAPKTLTRPGLNPQGHSTALNDSPRSNPAHSSTSNPPQCVGNQSRIVSNTERIQGFNPHGHSTPLHDSPRSNPAHSSTSNPSQYVGNQSKFVFKSKKSDTQSGESTPKIFENDLLDGLDEASIFGDF